LILPNPSLATCFVVPPYLQILSKGEEMDMTCEVIGEQMGDQSNFGWDGDF
jgi:hypothetical protein